MPMIFKCDYCPNQAAPTLDGDQWKMPRGWQQDGNNVVVCTGVRCRRFYKDLLARTATAPANWIPAHDR